MTTHTRLLLLTCLVAVTLLDACSALHVPNAPHVPLFTDRGELHGTVLFDALAGGFDGHLSWSPIRHLALVGSGIWVPELDSASGQEYVEGGIGGYMPLYSLRSRMPKGILGLSGPREAYMTYVAEMFLGAGRGESRGITRDLFETGERAADVGYNRIFIQGNIGVTNRLERVRARGVQLDPDSTDTGIEYYELAVAVKASRVDFNRFERQGVRLDTLIQPWFMQGALVGRYGREHIRGELQLGLTRANRELIPFDWLQFFVAIGVELKF